MRKGVKKNKEIIEQFLNDSRFQDPTIAVIEGRYRREQRQRAGRKTRRRKKEQLLKEKVGNKKPCKIINRYRYFI